MVIAPHLRGISVTVYSEGQCQNEYPDLDGPQPDRGISSYLEVKADAEFIIKCEVFHSYGPRNSDLSFIAAVDGVKIAMYRVPQADLVNKPYLVSNIDGFYKRVNSSHLVCRHLNFCGLSKVDDGDAARVKEDIKLLNGVGEITVYVHRTMLHGAERAFTAAVKEVKEVSEKSLKGQAISHTVAFGAEKHVASQQGMGTSFLDGEHNPIGVYRFKYRSREALQSMIVIPRSPSPDDVPSRQATNTQAKIKHEMIEIKEEDESGTNRKRPGSEISQSGRAYKTSRRSDGMVVVDLTGD